MKYYKNKSKLDEITQSSDIPSNDTDISITPIDFTTTNKNRIKSNKLLLNLIDSGNIVYLKENKEFSVITESDYLKLDKDYMIIDSNEVVDSDYANLVKFRYTTGLPYYDNILNSINLGNSDNNNELLGINARLVKLSYFQYLSIIANLTNHSVSNVLSNLVDYDEVSNLSEIYKNHLNNLGYEQIDIPVIDFTNQLYTGLNEVVTLSQIVTNKIIITCLVVKESSDSIFIKESISDKKYKLLPGLLLTEVDNSNRVINPDKFYVLSNYNQIKNISDSITKHNKSSNKNKNKNNTDDTVPYHIGCSTEKEFIGWLDRYGISHKSDYISQFLSILDNNNDSDYDNRVVYFSTSDYNKIKNYNKSVNNHDTNKLTDDNYYITSIGDNGKVSYVCRTKSGNLTFQDKFDKSILLPRSNAYSIIKRMSNKNSDLVLKVNRFNK